MFLTQVLRLYTYACVYVRTHTCTYINTHMLMHDTHTHTSSCAHHTHLQKKRQRKNMQISLQHWQEKQKRVYYEILILLKLELWHQQKEEFRKEINDSLAWHDEHTFNFNTPEPESGRSLQDQKGCFLQLKVQLKMVQNHNTSIYWAWGDGSLRKSLRI